MEEIIAFLQKNQKELSEKYTELEDLQGEMPMALFKTACNGLMKRTSITGLQFTIWN